MNRLSSFHWPQRNADKRGSIMHKWSVPRDTLISVHGRGAQNVNLFFFFLDADSMLKRVMVLQLPKRPGWIHPFLCAESNFSKMWPECGQHEARVSISIIICMSVHRRQYKYTDNNTKRKNTIQNLS